MSWHPTHPRPEAEHTGDRTIWVWELENGDGSEHRTVSVEVTGTAMSASTVHPRLEEARESRGEYEIVRLVEWNEPPRRIVFHSASEAPELDGGDPGPEIQELTEIIDWFAERGIVLFFTGRMVGYPGGNPISTSHTANLVDPDTDVLVQRFESRVSRLDAARAGREWWIENKEGGDVTVEAPPATAIANGGDATVKVDVPNISPEQREQLNRRQINLIVNGPTPGQEDSCYVIEAYSGAKLVGLTVGETADDAWLALFDELFGDEDA